MHGLTQDACESLNSLVLQRCPKDNFSGHDYLDFAIADAVIHFNDGKRGHSYIFPLLGLKMVYTLECIMKSGILVVLVSASARKST